MAAAVQLIKQLKDRVLVLLLLLLLLVLPSYWTAATTAMTTGDDSLISGNATNKRRERERESECIKTQRAVCRIEAKGKKGTVRHITPLSLSRWLSLVLARASRVCSLRPPPLRLYIINTARDIMYTLAADAGQHIRFPSQPTQHLYSLSLSLSSYAQPPHSLLTLLCPPSLHHPLILLFFFFFSSAFRFVLLSPLSSLSFLRH